MASSPAPDDRPTSRPTTRTVRVLRGLLIGGVAAFGGWMAFIHLSPPTPRAEAGAITCPFLAMDPPATESLWAFARGAEANGMSFPMALAVGLQVTYQQKGLGAAFRLEAPDIHRLREVPGVSHDDRFALYLPELRTMADRLAVDGRLSLQDLVRMKEWVADQEGVPVGESSEIETALAFVRAGGDTDTWTVDADELFRLLSGTRPTVDAVVTIGGMTDVREQARWTE